VIYVVGNSHFQMFLTNPAVSCTNVGPATVYGLLNNNSETNACAVILGFLKASKLTESDILVLVLGEIDCRIHIYRQSILRAIDPNVVIAETIDRYIKFLKLVSRSTAAQLVVLGAPPCSEYLWL
jgi:hypothetical protein